MGSTGYFNTTAEQAKAQELSGCTVITKSGNWVIARNASGNLFCVYFKAQRYGDEYVVKAIEASMGPAYQPSEAFYKRWVRESAKDANYSVSEYEQDWRDGCEATYARKRLAKTIEVGQSFTLARPYNYPQGIGRVDTFTLVDRKRRIATTPDGYQVRLPRGWESDLATN